MILINKKLLRVIQVLVVATGILLANYNSYCFRPHDNMYLQFERKNDYNKPLYLQEFFINNKNSYQGNISNAKKSYSFRFGIGRFSFDCGCFGFIQKISDLKREWQQKTFAIEFIKKCSVLTGFDYAQKAQEEYFSLPEDICSSFAREIFHERCSQLLCEFQHYQFDGFREYIKTIPGYSAHITSLYQLLQTDLIFKELAKKMPGYFDKSFESIITNLYCQELNNNKADTLLPSYPMLPHSGGINPVDYISIPNLYNQSTVPTRSLLNVEASAKLKVAVNKQKNCIDQLCKDYEEVIFDDCYDSRIEARYNALKKIDEDQIRVKSYTLPEHCYDALEKNKIPQALFEQCNGTQYQHILHKEFIDIVMQTVQLRNNQHTKAVTPLIYNATALGLKLNQQGEIVKTAMLADFCWAALDYAQAAGEGIVKGIQNTSNIVRHPIDFVTNFSYGMGNLAYHCSKVLYDIVQLNVDASFNPNRATSKVVSYVEEISMLAQALEAKWNNTSGRQIIRETSALITENFLTGKLIGSLNIFFKQAKKCSIKISKKVGDVFDNIPMSTLATPEGFHVGVGAYVCDGLVSCMENIENKINQIAKNVIQTTKKIVPLPIFFQKHFQQIELQISHLSKLFDGTKIKIKSLGEVTVASVDYMHIFSAEIQTIIKKGVEKLNLSGFHLDYLQCLEKEGIVKYVNKKIGLRGAFKADVVINGIVFEGKTFFPSHWNYEKCMRKIFESMKNATEVFTGSDGIRKIEGLTSEGIKIRTILDSSGRIKTSFPIIE